MSRPVSAYLPLSLFPKDAALIVLRHRRDLRVVLVHAQEAEEALRQAGEDREVCVHRLSRAIFGYVDMTRHGPRDPYGLDLVAARSGYGPALLRLAMAAAGEHGVVVSRRETTRATVITALRRLSLDPGVSIARSCDTPCAPRPDEDDVRCAVYRAKGPSGGARIAKTGFFLEGVLKAQGLDPEARREVWTEAGTRFFRCRYNDEAWCESPRGIVPRRVQTWKSPVSPSGHASENCRAHR